MNRWGSQSVFRLTANSPAVLTVNISRSMENTLRHRKDDSNKIRIHKQISTGAVGYEDGSRFCSLFLKPML